MFALRCVGISLAGFVVIYVPLSLAVSRGWTMLRRALRPQPASRSANLLFALRVAPFAVASLFTLVFTLPSYLLLEPRATNESAGSVLLVLGACCTALLGAGLVRTTSAQLGTRRALSQWLDGSTKMTSDHSIPVFRTGRETPTLTVAGVCKPKVVVSDAAMAALTASELRTALQHEVAHVRSHDNLKKLLFRLAAFPGMMPLEQAWSEEAELAADDAAVSSLSEALDLASALIKVSRLAGVQPPAVLATGLLHTATALSQRVERLFTWEDNLLQQRGWRWGYTLPPLAATLLLVVVTYGSALSAMHAVTERLMR